MASTTNWNTSTTTCAVGNNQSANNLTGFNLRPVGYRDHNGTGPLDVNVGSWIWTSTPSSSSAILRKIWNGGNLVHSETAWQPGGRSVRCLKN